MTPPQRVKKEKEEGVEVYRKQKRNVTAVKTKQKEDLSDYSRDLELFFSPFKFSERLTHHLSLSHFHLSWPYLLSKSLREE